MISASTEWANRSGGVAIIGMAGRFPGADDVDSFWRNLRAGVESIRFFSESELLAAGVDPERIARLRLAIVAALEHGDPRDAGPA